MASEPTVLSVLLVEDDDVDAMFIERNLLAGPGDPTELHRAHSLKHAITELGDRDFDVVLLDMGLPDGSGPGTIQCIAAASTAPIIVLTGTADEQTAVEAVRLGAQDYLLKSDFNYRSLRNSMRFATERQRRIFEADQKRLQENAIKDQLLSHVSHELRTPLTAVLQFVSILRDGIAGELNPQQTEYTNIILRNVEQLKRMISTLMDATRATTGKLSYEPRRVAIEEIVRDAVHSVESIAAAKQVELVIAPNNHSGEVIADAQRVVQVLRNLLENAVKFTPSGNSVQVEVDLDGASPDQIQVAVRDTGCGIAPEDLPQVFDRMFQVGEQRDVCRKGLGLGLHIAQEIVAMHGGQIDVTSELDKGSRFRFPLPRFSIESFVRKVALVDDRIEASIALLAVTIRAQKGVARAKGVDSVVPTVQGLIEGCTHSSSDVMLPHRPERHQVTLLALARTDSVGIEAIARRVQQEFDRHDELQQWGFSVAMTGTHFPTDPDLPPDHALPRLVETVRQQITTIERTNP